MHYISSLYINSGDRLPGTALNNSIYNLNRQGITTVDYMAVHSISMLNQSYDFTGTFSYVFNSTPYAFTYGTGSPLGGEYSGIDLATSLQANIRSQTTSTKLTVVYSNVTGQLTFDTHNASTMNIINNFSGGTGISQNLTPKQIGMIIDQSVSALLIPSYPLIAATVFTLNYPVNLAYTQYFDFTSNQICTYQRKSGSTGISRPVIYRLKNNLGFGTQLSEKEINYRYIKYDRNQEIAQIDISIYDEYGNLAQLNNSEYSIEIALFSCELSAAPALGSLRY